MHEFSWWDDPATLHQNRRLNPPTLDGILYYWQQPHIDLYVPVTYTIWGGLAKLAYSRAPDATGIHLNPMVFHVASIAVHVLSVLLVFQILLRLVRHAWAACAGALLFALHPVQVEAIGWTSRMKDLLAGMFPPGRPVAVHPVRGQPNQHCRY